MALTKSQLGKKVPVQEGQQFFKDQYAEKVALIVEEYAILAELLQTLGHKVFTYSHRYLLDGTSDSLFQRLRDGDFTSVWLTMPSRTVAGRSEHSMVGKLAALARVSASCGILTVLGGSEHRIPGRSQVLQNLISNNDFTLT